MIVMKLKRFVYIFAYAKTEHVVTIEDKGYWFKVYSINPNKMDDVLEIARNLYHEDKCELIELCGSFGPEWIYKVSKELDHKIPVGGAFYGPNFHKQLLELVH